MNTTQLKLSIVLFASLMSSCEQPAEEISDDNIVAEEMNFYAAIETNDTNDTNELQNLDGVALNEVGE